VIGAWGANYTTGFSGLAAASTGPQGTGSSQTAPATSAPGGVSQGIQSIGATCGICQNPIVKAGLFFVAILAFWVFWHTHLKSVME